MTSFRLAPFSAPYEARADQIALEAYGPDFWEPVSLFAKRIERFPQGCRLLFRGDELVGYTIGHPWSGGRIELGEDIDTLPARPDFYYIHDVVVGNDHQGAGAGRFLYRHHHALAVSLALREIRLVSVGNSRPFWEKQGFELVETFRYGKEGVGALMRLGL